MAASMCGLNICELRKKCTKLLGKAASKHFIPILSDIFSVACGLKSSFLYDYTRIKAAMLKEFVEVLLTEGIIAQGVQLVVVSIDEDTLVCNVACLQMISHTHKHYIDVSSYLEAPTLLNRDESNTFTIEYMKQLDAVFCRQSESAANQNMPSDRPAIQLVDLQLPLNINRSTMYGLLLGYPIVYYYTTENVTDSSQISVCLDYVPLKVYKVSAKCKWTERTKHILYSFSCPEELISNSEDTIQNWFSALQKVDINEYFDDISLDIENVTLPTVSL